MSSLDVFPSPPAAQPSPFILPSRSPVEQLFDYDPSQPAAIAAAVIFFLLSILQFFLYRLAAPACLHVCLILMQPT